MGKFDGSIEAKGDLIVGKGAHVECDYINVNSITVHGLVTAKIEAKGKVDLMSGSEVHGDIHAGRLRIADNVLFEGSCSMIDEGAETEIFDMTTAEIKTALRRGIRTDADEVSEITAAEDDKNGIGDETDGVSEKPVVEDSENGAGDETDGALV